MRTKNRFMLLFILILIPMVSSIQVYSGDSEIINLSEQYDYYSIVGNSTPIDLTIVQNELEVTITFNKYQQTDNFTIIFFNKEKEIITETRTVYSGGGGSTKYVDRNITTEVPKFYDRNITNTIEIPTEVIKEIKTESSKIWFYVSLFVIFLCIVLAILYLWASSRKDIINNERRFNEKYE